MKNYKFKINGNLYEVEVLDVDRNTAKIEVNGTLYNVELEMEIPKIKSAPAATLQRPVREVRAASSASASVAGAGAPAGKAIEVRAPLPGVIIQVLVRQGDDVKTGQTLCTLETMKMENAIKADKDGKVTAVNVSPAQTVIQDEVLIIMSV